MNQVNKRIMIAVIGAIITILGVYLRYMIPVDNFIFNIVGYIHTPWLTLLMKFISILGSAIIYFIFCFIFLMVKKDWGIMLSCNVSIAFLINTILKMIFARPRPMLMLVQASGYSLPSGHSCCAMAFYGTLAYLIGRSKTSLKKTYIVGCMCVIFLIGFSRIYLRVHYFSDVCTGFFVGYAVINVLIYYIFKEGRRQ